jgi:hemoglobin/transferrin/lactoferrin receptor protein
MREDFFSSNKKPQIRGEIIHFALLLTERNIQNTPFQNSADLITTRSLLFSKKESLFGQSTTFRGFSSNNNLLSIDGIVLSNDFGNPYSSQLMNQFDPNILHKIELLYGNQSITYGKDALGSVTTLYTPEVDFFGKVESKHQFSSKASFFSSLMGGSFYLNHQYQRKKFFTYSALSLTHYSQYQIGQSSLCSNSNVGMELLESIYDPSLQKDVLLPRKDPYAMPHALIEYGQFAQKFGWKLDEHQIEASIFVSKNPEINFSKNNQQISSSSQYAQWQIQNPLFVLGNLLFKSNHSNSLWTKATAAISFSKNGSSESYRKMDSIKWESIEYFIHKILFQWDVYKNYDARRVFFYGLMSNISWIQCNTQTGPPAIFKTEENPLTSHHFIYFKEEYRLSDNVSLHWGGNLGIDHTELLLKNKLDPTSTFLSKNQLSASANVSWTRHSCENSNYTISLTYNRRPPNANEYYPMGNGYLFIPNPSLLPQQSLSLEGAAYKKIEDQLEFHISPFLYVFQNKISNIPTILNNQLYYQMINIQRSYMIGGDLVSKFHWTKTSMIYGQISYNYGRDIENNTPLSTINPIYGKIGFKQKIKKLYFDLAAVYQGAKQPWLYSQSIDENALFGSYQNNEFMGSPSFIAFNFNSSFYLSKSFEFHAAINNVLDENYRGYGSSISGLGRTFCLSIRTQF